jgi:type I restriction enzyme S subunit
MVWSYKKLSELADVSSGGTPKRSNKEFWGGDIPWYSSGELNDFNTIPPKEHITESGLTSSNAKLFPRGSLLIGMYDTAALKMSLLDREGTFNQAIAGVKPNKNINLSFILYAINSMKPELLKLRRGVRQKNLNQGMIKDILIPDIPLIEQERIVALLDTVFADLEQTRAKTEQNLKNSRELFDSYLQQVFSQKGDGWVERSLSEVSNLSMGQSPKGSSYNSEGEGVPLINGPVEFGPSAFSKTIKSKYTTEPSKMCKKGDLILCVRGSTTGRMNIAGFDACIGRGVASISSEKYQEWLNHYINFNRSTIYSMGTGATFPNVSRAMLAGFKVVIPPVEIMPKVIKEIKFMKGEIEKVADIYTSKILALDELKKSILQKAFSGELTTTAK